MTFDYIRMSSVFSIYSLIIIQFSPFACISTYVVVHMPIVFMSHMGKKVPSLKLRIMRLSLNIRKVNADKAYTESANK